MGIVEELQALHEHLEQGGDGVSFDICGIAKQAAAEIVRLRAELPPVLPGQELYLTTKEGRIHKWLIRRVTIGQNDTQLVVAGGTAVLANRIGKDLFLTEEEAKEAAQSCPNK